MMNIIKAVSHLGRNVVGKMMYVAVLAAMTLGFDVVPEVMAQGAGDLVVAPTRVVLEGRTRTAQLTLLNKGSATATFRISAINMRMEDDGTVREIDKPDPGQHFASKLFRYSPRQVTLKPGAAQAIRILLRKPKGIADGEYRSHMMFRGVPNDSGESVENTGPADGIAVRLIPVYGITIPIIVRHGKTEAKVSLSELKMLPADETNKLPRLKYRIQREGSRSVFGDLTATYVPTSGSEVVISQLMRLAVYSPNKSRSVEMLLRVPEGLKLSGGRIKLSYKAIPDAGGKLFSEAELAVR
jgi:hypothetical protein